jgi:hypothetical protein
LGGAAGLPGVVADGLGGAPFFWAGLFELFGFGFEGAEGLLPPPGVFGFGVVVVGVVRPLDGVVEVEVVVVGVVFVEPELLCDGQDSLTFWTGPGRLSEDTGAPGGSWKVRTFPVSSVTVTVQSAAEAVGNAATPDTTSAVPADANATLSFRRVNKVALSPPAVPLAATVQTPSNRRTLGPSY